MEPMTPEQIGEAVARVLLVSKRIDLAFEILRACFILQSVTFILVCIGLVR